MIPIKCPKCGSEMSTHKEFRYWTDKKGNIKEVEE